MVATRLLPALPWQVPRGRRSPKDRFVVSYFICCQLQVTKQVFFSIRESAKNAFKNFVCDFGQVDKLVRHLLLDLHLSLICGSPGAIVSFGETFGTGRFFQHLDWLILGFQDPS